MEITTTRSDFARWIASTLRGVLNETQDGFEIRSRTVEGDQEGSSTQLSNESLDSTLSKLQGLNVSQEVTLLGARTYEVPLKDVGAYARMRLRLRDASIRVVDTENLIIYQVGSPSDEYILFLLLSVHEKGGRTLVEFVRSSSFLASRAPLETNAFDAVRRVLRNFLTIKISSERNRSFAEFDRFANSLLFNLSYNLDSPLVRHQSLDEMVSNRRIVRLRTSKIAELDAPRRYYIPDLVHHYQLALSVDSPSLRYLSYYHISEHFFEEVFNEDVIGHVREMLTKPDFSYKRKSDLSNLIKLVSRRLQIRDERIVFNEQEALRLVISKFVNLNALAADLGAYDPKLLAYYASTKVGFASADVVDLSDTDETKVQKQLARRIYSIRNAIVHSKESEKGKYTPFRDDEVLVNDIMILRFIAEQIIIASSQVI